MSGTICEISDGVMTRPADNRHYVAALLVVIVGLGGVPLTSSSTQAGGRLTRPQAVTTIPVPASVDVTLQALARLHQYGYTINTPARADRAIRHWQTVNGLTVDGIVGPQTIASLGLSSGAATASVPAVRQTPPVPAADPEGIIREVWPDELEDRAIQIAHRESRLDPTARNACCLGLFQIYYRVHRAWLADLGINGPDDLLDARANTTAAYALYQRNGWAPWSL